MKAEELRLLTSRVAEATGLRKLVLLGSQSLHAYSRELPDVVLGSLEADYLLLEDAPPEAARKIELQFGRESSFQNEHGVYADLAVYGLALLPPRWNERLREEIIGDGALLLYSLEPHDLAISKLYADRPKDIEFLADALDTGIISQRILEERIAEFGNDPHQKALLGARLQLLPSKIGGLREEQREEQLMLDEEEPDLPSYLRQHPPENDEPTGPRISL